MRGELFDPDGDSVTPISPRAMLTIFSPTVLPTGAPTPPTPAVVVVALPAGVIAPWSIDEKSVDEPPPVVDDGVAVVAVLGEMGCGVMSWLSSDTRMTT